MRYIILVMGLSLLILSGCGQSDTSKGETGETVMDEKAAMQKTDPAGTYGKEITMTEKTSISDILANPETFEGKTVLVSGTIVDVCEKRGCWIDLAGEKEFEQIQFKVKDGEMVFPVSAKGSVALVEGVVEKLQLTKKQAVKRLIHEAEEHGEECDTTTVTGPLNIWRIKGIGAEIKS